MANLNIPVGISDFEKIIKNYLRGWKYQKTLHCAKNG